MTARTRETVKCIKIIKGKMKRIGMSPEVRRSTRTRRGLGGLEGRGGRAHYIMFFDAVVVGARRGRFYHLSFFVLELLPLV